MVENAGTGMYTRVRAKGRPEDVAPVAAAAAAVLDQEMMKTSGILGATPALVAVQEYRLGVWVQDAAKVVANVS